MGKRNKRETSNPSNLGRAKHTFHTRLHARRPEPDKRAPVRKPHRAQLDGAKC